MALIALPWAYGPALPSVTVYEVRVPASGSGADGKHYKPT